MEQFEVRAEAMFKHVPVYKNVQENDFHEVHG